ncbi:lipopolysaccharide biosynthesis protein [Oryzobacter sp. R7]|uniref:lipopolysaccharide biosynthesis protein n=1 Tax=Oryzobacter faecalis TaxID=3388656 RepID=UPI00398D047F
MNARTIAGFAVGPVATAAISLVTVPAVTWAFSADDVGRFNILQLSVSFVVLLASMGLDQGYVREFHETDDAAVLVRSAFLPCLLVAMLLTVPAVVLAEPLAQLLFDLSDPRVIWLVAASSLAALLARLLSLVLRMKERSLAFSASQAVPKLLFLVVLGPVFLIAVTREFLLLEVALLISWVAAAVVTAWATRDTWFGALSARLDRQLLRRLLRYSLPLVVAGLGYWALTAASSVALRSMSSLAELGVYSVALSFAGAAVVVQSIFSVVWAPVVYRWAVEEHDLDRVDRVAGRLLAVVALVFCAVGAFSFLLDLVLPARYDAVKYLVLATIAAPLLYTLSEVTGIGINLARRTSWSVAATVLALLVSAVLNLLLVPLLGAQGAVLATMVAYVAFLVMRTEASRQLWRPLPRGRLYVTVTVLCSLAAATVLVGPDTGHWTSLVWAALTPVVLVAFRREWPAMLRPVSGAWTR